jgi:hypothetical protein
MKNKIVELRKLIKNQQKEIEDLKRRARKQKWWNVYFAWK